MPANRPNKETQLAREVEAWDWRCKGLSHSRIAAKLGVTRRAIGIILDRVEARELERLAKSVERIKTVQNGQLEHIIDESFQAWRKSKKPRSRAVEKEVDGEKATQTEALEQTGDPRHLATAMSAMDRQRSLWGLDVQAAAQEMPPR